MEQDFDPKGGRKAGGLQQPAATSDAGGCSLGVRRTGAVVQINITCAHDYAAIALYEQVVAASQEGFVSLKLKSQP